MDEISTAGYLVFDGVMRIVYVDIQNIHKGIQKLGRIIDWMKYYNYMKTKYSIDKIIMFIGYLDRYKTLYRYLEHCGYELVFKETMLLRTKQIKGNVDIDLAIRAVDDWHHKVMNQFFLATGDGDYNSLIYFFKERNALGKVFIPWKCDTSRLLTKAAENAVVDLSNLKSILSK